MLRVKTYTASDARGGIGLFSAQDIKKGDVVSCYDPNYSRIIGIDEYFRLRGDELAYVQKYSYPDYSPDDDPPTVGVILCLDNARFSNHSATPNTRIYPNNPNASIACSDIRYGEEITCDYFEFDPDDVIHKMGIITGKTFLIKSHVSAQAL